MRTTWRIGKIGIIRTIGSIGVIGSMRRGYHSPIIPIFPIFPINFTSISALISREKGCKKGNKRAKGSERVIFSTLWTFWTLRTLRTLITRNKFVVRRVPSATLGKNGDNGLYLKYCSLSEFFLGAAIDPLSQQIRRICQVQYIPPD